VSRPIKLQVRANCACICQEAQRRESREQGCQPGWGAHFDQCLEHARRCGTVALWHCLSGNHAFAAVSVPGFDRMTTLRSFSGTNPLSASRLARRHAFSSLACTHQVSADKLRSRTPTVQNPNTDFSSHHESVTPCRLLQAFSSLSHQALWLALPSPVASSIITVSSSKNCLGGDCAHGRARASILRVQ
jgi:hypothetical protein